MSALFRTQGIRQSHLASCTKGQGVASSMGERYLTEIDVAERTQISLKTLRRWRLERRGPTFRKFGSLVRYGEEELIRWEQANQAAEKIALSESE
jgi:predicted DNA-binding transcriptional regulator AlpA